MSKNQIYVIIGAGCLLAVCAVAALFAGIFYFTPLFSNQVVAPISDITSIESNTRSNADGNSMGDLDALIYRMEQNEGSLPVGQDDMQF